MIERIKKVVGALYSFAKESKKSQRRNKNEYSKYMVIYNELLLEALEIKKRKSLIIEELENEDLDIRFIKSHSQIPGYLGIRYVFISDIQPGKLYREIPKLNKNGFATTYDTCYVNGKNQVLRRIASEESFPEETLYFYQDDEVIEVSFNYQDNATITGISKATFNRENNILEIKEIKGSLGNFEDESSGDKIPLYDCVIHIDKYSFCDTRLEECSLNYCEPLARPFSRFPKDPEKTKWEIYESRIQIKRNEDHLPTDYISEWILSGFRLIEEIEEHTITQKQRGAITRLEHKLYI